ncbi:MAG: class I SAM-dependent methyltransferase, partial [Spirochaetaceae bacterium]
GRVLVTFGGDDPRGITARVVAALLSTRRFAADDIDVLLPGLSPNAANATGTAATAPASSPLSGVRVIRAPLDLRSAMAAYETVVTSFGLTAFEAAWVGADVLLVNASRYHARLARRAGFRSVAVGRPSQRRLVRLFARRIRTGGGAERVRHRLAGADSVSLASLIDGLAVPQVHDCPACGASDGRVLGRFECRTYVRCGDCDMIYLRCFEEPRDYPADYFFDEYRRQYGRTYLEDAPHIKAMGHRRLGEIERAMPRRRPAHARLIDLGCAYGPFLSASAERGYAVVGVDVSETAVSHIRSELGFPAFHMHLEELASTAGRPRELESGGATVVTMWYVIEHLPKLEQVLAAVRELLGSDGVFAFSTPNRVGISGRRSIREFLRRSPQDHYTVWSPRTARRVLARHGFRVRRIRITGHHPERFPGASRLRTGGTARRIVLALSRVLKLGDTFEVYAVKRGGGAR